MPGSIATIRRLLRDRRGVALLEFGYALPIVLGIGLYGVEIANLAITNLRVSQVALNLADNASRVGARTPSNTFQLREFDIAEVLAATRIHAQRLKLLENGRVILSSLEEEGGRQRIHWQRCIGLKGGTNYISHYGATEVQAGTAPSTSRTSPFYGTVTTGMGIPAVTAPTGSGVMFVEVNYEYQPLFGDWLVGKRRIHHTASFIIRDRRDLTQLFLTAPSTPASRMTCDKYTL